MANRAILKKGSWHFDIPDVHPSLNTWTRMHFHLRNNLKHDWETMTVMAARQSGLPKITSPVSVYLIYHHPRKNVDLDNYTPKFILDGLKQFFVDDNIEHVQKLGWEFKQSKDKHTTVIVEEI